MPLDSLALSRGTVDRLTEKRTDTAWLDAAWADPGTRVLVVSDGQALARIDDEQAGLVFVPPAAARLSPASASQCFSSNGSWASRSRSVSDSGSTWS